MFRSKRFILLIILIIAIIVCVLIRSIGHSTASSTVSENSETTALPSVHITTPSVTTAQTETAAAVQTEEPNADEPYVTLSRYEQIKERMKLLQESCPDFIGWLYVADSDMDLPVVQGSDNFYYLSHTPDGAYIKEGTIFLDCNNSPDLTDLHNIHFGHNMSSGMFGDIRSYKNRDEFDKHRCGWFFTADKTYRIEFFALSIVSAYDMVYDISSDHSEWLKQISDKAMYTSDLVPEESDRIISLSTCASDFENARALFSGILVPIENEEEIISQLK